MALTWKYKIDLEDKNIFNKFYDKYHIEVPHDIQDLVSYANGGTPSKVKIKDENNRIRVLGAVLSYNEQDDDTVYLAMEAEHSKRNIPFAIDPFGNYFYENILFGEIVFVDHETGEISRIADSLTDMLAALYE